MESGIKYCFCTYIYTIHIINTFLHTTYTKGLFITTINILNFPHAMDVLNRNSEILGDAAVIFILDAQCSDMGDDIENIYQ